VGVLGRGGSHRLRMQDRNLEEENCYENKNITGLECARTQL
jgi:hypothetical protein